MIEGLTFLKNNFRGDNLLGHCCPRGNQDVQKWSLLTNLITACNTAPGSTAAGTRLARDLLYQVWGTIRYSQNGMKNSSLEEE